MFRPTRATAEADLSVNEAIDRIQLLRTLTPAQRDRLRSVASLVQLGRGDAVWSLEEAAERYMFLASGHVKLQRRREDGREVILDIRGPGELLCAGAVTSSTTYCCSARVISKDVIALSLPRAALQGILEESAPTAVSFFREAASHEMRLTDRVFELASGQVDQRVAALLLRLADQLGVPGIRGDVRIPVRLARQDLADLCGTTLESAIRAMTRLARNRAVTTLADGFLISNRRYLEALASGERRSR